MDEPEWSTEKEIYRCYSALLFHDVGECSNKDITTFLKSQKKHSSFKMTVHNMTREIIDLRLDWCKLMAYNEGSFGGWIAENWIAYLRISK